nr:reverse transcriptase domain-containing protein [Tanacetum cinerariifolium]GEY91994.1 reverse transcriptase domain-containing protein [Tanacetum cinerariifolium]
MDVDDATSSHVVRPIIDDYPFAVDGLEIWSVIKSWVKVTFCIADEVLGASLLKCHCEEPSESTETVVEICHYQLLVTINYIRLEAAAAADLPVWLQLYGHVHGKVSVLTFPIVPYLLPPSTSNIGPSRTISLKEDMTLPLLLFDESAFKNISRAKENISMLMERHVYTIHSYWRSQPTSAVRNTLGKEQAPQNLVRPISDEDLQEYCDKNYHHILPIIAEKVHQEKAQQEKLKAVKAHLNFEEASRYSESETPSRRRNLKERLGPRLGDKEKNVSAHSRGSEQKSYYSNHFTPRIRYFDFPKSRMPSHIKTYVGSEDPKDHLKIFQVATKTKRWAMPTWCHMFNSTLTGNARVWFDDLPKESIDNYDDLRKAFLENYLQQKKCIKDPVEIHNIKQKDRESTKEFVRRYKLECRDVKGASECMKISGFMHEITHPELIKRLHDKFPKSMDEMMSVTTTFLRGEVAASNRERKKSFSSWKQEA